MLVVMKNDATEAQVQAVIKEIEDMGYRGVPILDAVYVDAKKSKSIIAIRPKPPFKPIFQVAASREGSDIRILNEPIEGSSVFLVETGEASSTSYRSIPALLKQRRALAVKFI
jgi:hypothetical protein